MPEENTVANKKSDNTNLVSEISGKINEAQNILIALSSDPSVDEMSAAIGLSLFLDKLGKRATAIYSGTTPNALEFLKPEETFEPTIDALQDFVIALSKEKADHLRYKLDGDFVKIYITPYKTRIAEEDLDYSYGDFNVDLVLAFDVANGVDLDSALREHGRIMHDAVIINVTTGNPGKLGEIEWSDKNASSVSEMIAELIYSMDGDVKMGKEEATAFLTGIVAATDRFSKANTTPEAMRIASRLMESGADQQLVSKNITSDIQNELLSFGSSKENEKTAAPAEPVVEAPIEAPAETPQEAPKDIEEDSGETLKIPQDEPDLLDDLKAAEASLANNSAEIIPEPTPEPVKLEEEPVAAEPEPVPEPVQEEPTPAVEPEPVAEPEPTPTTEPATEPAPDTTGFVSDKPEKVIQPSESMNEPLMAGSNKYGQMLEDALTSIDDPMAQAQPQVVTPPTANPAMANAPAVPTAPEINGVPSMNYAPLPSDQVLPPPPAPPVDPNAAMPTAPAVQPTMQPVVESAPQPTPQPVMQPVMPTVQPIAPAAPPVAPTPDSLGSQPAMQDQVYGPQASDPSAFKIPGM